MNEELEHLNRVLNRNGYNNKDINQTTIRLKNKIAGSINVETPIEEEVEGEGEEGEKRKWTVLPYIQGTTERISRILSKHKIMGIFKPQRKIAQLLPNLKDQRPHLETPGVYKIPCACGKVYIGETGRKISTVASRNINDIPNTAISLNQLWPNTGRKQNTRYNMTRQPY